jgi:alanyl-tRNA synthetase
MKHNSLFHFRLQSLKKRHYSSNSLKWTSLQIRKSFLEYFQKNHHVILPSSPLIPENDPSLLFTAAGRIKRNENFFRAAVFFQEDINLDFQLGMVQFKDYFLGLKVPDYKKVATIQKCLRVGNSFILIFILILFLS